MQLPFAAFCPLNVHPLADLYRAPSCCPVPFPLRPAVLSAAAIAAAVLQRWRQRHSPPACPTPAPTHENGADGPGVLRLRPHYLLTALAAPSASSVRAELYCSAVALLPLSRIGRPAPQPSRRRWLLCECVCCDGCCDGYLVCCDGCCVCVCVCVL